MPRVQVEALPSPSFEGCTGAGLTPTLKTPEAQHESFLRRTELSPTVAPTLQARTSALISKVEKEVLPRLKEKQGWGDRSTANLSNTNNRETAPVAHHQHQQKEHQEDASAASLMRNMNPCDESTYTSGISKELECAKECLHRAEIMLLVQRKTQDTPVEDHHDVRSLLQHAGKLIHQAQAELSGAKNWQ